MNCEAQQLQNKLPNIGIYFSSNSGRTKRAAQAIARFLGTENLFDVSTGAMPEMGKFDLTIIGCPTYGKGELHFRFSRFLKEKGDTAQRGKDFAIFTLGNSKYYPDTFGGALVLLEQWVVDRGCNILGKSRNSSDYASHHGGMIEMPGENGLVIDVSDSRIEQADRISRWSKLIRDCCLQKREKSLERTSNFCPNSCLLPH